MEPKFNLDRPKVSDDEINKHKDFSNLVKQFKEQSIQKARSDVNFLKNKKATYAAVIAGVAVICTVTYFTVFKNNNTKTAKNDKTNTLNETKNTQNTIADKKAFINPPSKKINVPYNSYKINSAKGGEIAHHTASKIKVPAKAFVNKAGMEIVGDVEIHYREMHDRAEIIASGIPMTYDSAGTQYHFESAGMFDIKASQNGEEVYLKRDKPVTVEMVSRQSADSYNQYYLDTVKQNWVVIKHDSPVMAKSKPPENAHAAKEAPVQIKKLEQKIELIPVKIDSVKTVYTKKIDKLPEPKQPSKPSKATPGKPKFELDVDYKDFPELSAFKNAQFEVGNENTNYSKELHSITWNSATISEGPQKGKNYLLTLVQRQKIVKLIVYPVLTDADYAVAQSTYEKKFIEYNKLLEKKEADELKLKQEMEAKQKAYVEEQKKLSAEILKERIRMQKQQESSMNEEIATANSEFKVIRVFQISNFGIYNSDCPKQMPKGGNLKVIYALNDNDLPLQPSVVYMVEHGSNKLFTYDNKSFYDLKYDSDKEYTVCVFVKGEIYIYNKEKFSEAVAEKKRKLIVSPLPEGNADISGLRSALEI